jgi:hypothetical protein
VFSDFRDKDKSKLIVLFSTDLIVQKNLEEIPHKIIAEIRDTNYLPGVSAAHSAFYSSLPSGLQLLDGALLQDQWISWHDPIDTSFPIM